jgi:thioredoxin reductase (NADPH)
MKLEKVIIVGGGPAGLTAAIYCARAGLNPLVLAGEEWGGQLMITTEVENYPGYPNGVEGPELIDNLIAQAKRFNTRIINEKATNFILKTGGPFKLTAGKEEYQTDSLILANGASAQWLNLPEEDRYRNVGLSACATCDGPLPIFRNRRIFVIGGGDSAMEEALFLARFASKVTVIHRRDKLRASKIMQDRAFENKKIEFMWNHEVIQYIGDKKLEAIKVRNLVSGEISEFEAVGLFMAIGHKPNTEELINTQLDFDDSGYIVTKDNVHTNIEGVFAAGDVHDTVYKQGITAAGFGCMAAIAAERWLESKIK